jgi:asparagine synthase (glutamine-hydrolysing)
MCGIAGAWKIDVDEAGSLNVRVCSMAAAIRHRGPDDAGTWLSEDGRVALAHQRLAIQDLSALGHQPMTAPSGRYVIVFNGEIYNFKRLSVELGRLGFTFRGHSDTEVMLAAFDAWGVEESLRRFDGMFAFAVYDTQLKEMWLARDRMGEKPLYYSFVDGRLLFCSELKGLLVGVGRKLPLNWAALGGYFRFGYFSVTETPFNEIRKLAPAASVRINEAELRAVRETGDVEGRAKQYWRRPLEVGAPKTDAVVVSELEQLLSEAVADQSVADVNLGVFLSGGIDSTLVAALSQNLGTGRINTYTIAFDSPEYNEAPFARDIARHLGTHHVEIPVAIDECLEVIEQLPLLLDEPFADASLIPSYLVCREARKHATVCLSGDGGDELFGGYNRYIQGARLAQMSGRLPRQVRALVGRGISATPEKLFDALYSPFARMSSLSGRKPEKDIGAKLHKIGRALLAQDNQEIYAGLLSFWSQTPLLNASVFPSLAESLVGSYRKTADFAEAAMDCDLGFYLVSDNLFKADRAAMASSLEVRLPLLDRRVVEYAAGLPIDQKIRNGRSKFVLREILYRYIPPSLIDRPKMGFSLPLAVWFRAGLKRWVEEQLENRDWLIAAGLNPNVLARTWGEHTSGRGDNANALWTVLAYLQWLEANSEWIDLG